MCQIFTQKIKSVRGCPQGDFGCRILHAFDILSFSGVTDVVHRMSYSEIGLLHEKYSLGHCRSKMVSLLDRRILWDVIRDMIFAKKKKKNHRFGMEVFRFAEK